MATDGVGRAALASVSSLLLLALPAQVHAAAPWWEPVAFGGQRVAAVVVLGGHLVVESGGHMLVSADGGRSFRPAGAPSGVRHAPGSPQWLISHGVVLTDSAGAGLRRDPGAPYLGDGAQLIAAPAALPGVVLAVGTDNHVWRRIATGRWATSFIPLPAGALAGTPRVTALAAFARPVTAAVYMATDGYGVLLTENGGDDWIRADPGLPAHVLSLATDPAVPALYAATDGGLFVHHLQSFPAPPAYRDAALWLRWLGIAGVALLAALGALLGLRHWLPAPAEHRAGMRQ